MRYPNVEEIKKLTQKLEKQNDIFLEEADWIYSLFSPSMLRTKLNPNSSKADRDLMHALKGWYQVIAQKIEQGHRGNFIFTITLVESLPKSLPKNTGRPGSFINEVQKNARKSLEKHGRFEDLFSKLIIDRGIYSSLPKELQKLFIEETKDQQGESFYILKSPRANMYHYPIKTEKGVYTIAQFMENFAPIMTTRNYNVGDIFLKTIRGAYSTLLDFKNSWYLHNLDKSVIVQCVIAAYMKYKELPCVTMLKYNNKDSPFVFDGAFVFFTEKDKAKTIKDALKIPLEDIIKNTLNEKAINAVDKKMLENLLYKDHIIRFPDEEFIEVSIKYIDNIIQRQKEWETTRQSVEDEDVWLEEIR